MHSLEVSTLITVWALMGVEPGYPVARGWSVPVVQGFASGDMFFFFFCAGFRHASIGYLRSLEFMLWIYYSEFFRANDMWLAVFVDRGPLLPVLDVPGR